jgi:hypothetical protein
MKFFKSLLLSLLCLLSLQQTKAGVLDVGTVKLLSPKVFLCLGDTVPLNMVIQNFGSDTVYSVPVRVNIGGIVPFVLLATSTKTLLPGDTAVVYLGDVPCPTNGLYHFTFFTQLNGDANLQNDTSYQTSYIANTTFPMQRVDAHRCGSGALQISASVTDGLIYWYASDTSSNSIGIGETFQTPNLSFTQTYWAEPHANVHVNLGERDTTFASFNGTNFLTDAMSFDVFEGMVLDSVKVYPMNPGMLVMRLINNQNVVLYRDTFYFPNANGVGRFVNLHWQLQKGVGYRMDALGTNTGLLRNTSGAKYPYEVPYVVSINGNTINSNYYLYFYDWHFRLGGCAGPRQPVNAFIRTTPPNANFSIQSNGALVIFTNNTTNADSVWWNFGDGIINITWQPNHLYSKSGLYFVTLYAKNDCGIDSFKMGINVIAGLSDIASNSGVISPNPSSDWIQWSLPTGANPIRSSVCVYSIDGKRLPVKLFFENGRIHFDISTLPQGNYEIQMRTQNGLLMHNRFNKL